MQIKDFKEDCLMSTNISDDFELLSGFEVYPATLDNRDKVLQTEDQGTTSECACYSATSLCEAINWRKHGNVDNLDPHKVYKLAKSFDGYPNQNGTTLDAALKSAIRLNYLTSVAEKDVVCFRGINILKKVIHKYDVCLVGFNVSKLWMSHFGKLVLNGDPGSSAGGHCVTCVGYNRAGLIIQNSWNKSWGKYGFAVVSWDLVDKQFMYGAYIKNCLNDLG